MTDIEKCRTCGEAMDTGNPLRSNCGGDWDCQQDSAYWDHPVVQKVMRELHPRWFKDGA